MVVFCAKCNFLHPPLPQFTKSWLGRQRLCHYEPAPQVPPPPSPHAAFSWSRCAQLSKSSRAEKTYICLYTTPLHERALAFVSVVCYLSLCMSTCTASQTMKYLNLFALANVGLLFLVYLSGSVLSYVIVPTVSISVKKRPSAGGDDEPLRGENIIGGIWSHLHQFAFIHPSPLI